MNRHDLIKGLIVGTPAVVAAGCTCPADTTPPAPAGVTLADFAATPVDREALITSLGLEFTAAERALVFPLLDSSWSSPESRPRCRWRRSSSSRTGSKNSNAWRRPGRHPGLARTSPGRSG